MNEAIKTTIFLAIAAVMAGAGYWTHLSSQPKPIGGFERVGEPFFPDFDDANAIALLEVMAANGESEGARTFKIEYSDGLWRLPSHNNYPADAKDRLAKLAAEIMSMERDMLASRNKSDHERFHVIAPTEEDLTLLKSRGIRVTAYRRSGGENGELEKLADFIVGRKVDAKDEEENASAADSGEEERNAEGYYFVRAVDETETYKVDLNLNLSTRFRDWIEQDLLKVTPIDIVSLNTKDYRFDKSTGVIGLRDRIRLERPDATGDWQLEGLNEETQELNATKVNEVLSALDEMKILGVRQKLRGIKPDLTIDRNFINSRKDMEDVQINLQSRGFFIGPDEDGNPYLYGTAGEITAATKKGIVFDLRFGDVFTGTELEVQVGTEVNQTDANQKESETDDKNKDSAKGETKDTDSEKSDEPEEEESLTESRYLLVSARYDPQHIGEEPQPPTKPQPPVGERSDDDTSANDTEDSNAGESSEESSEENDEANSNSEQNVDPDADNATGSDSTENDTDSSEGDSEKQPARPSPESIYQADLRKYEADKKRYEEDLREYQEKLKEGRKLTEEINERFADWYYVISTETYERLSMNREKLVSPKLPESPDGGNGLPTELPEIPSDLQLRDDTPATPE